MGGSKLDASLCIIQKTILICFRFIPMVSIENQLKFFTAGIKERLIWKISICKISKCSRTHILVHDRTLMLAHGFICLLSWYCNYVLEFCKQILRQKRRRKNGTVFFAQLTIIFFRIDAQVCCNLRNWWSVKDPQLISSHVPWLRRPTRKTLFCLDMSRILAVFP